MANKKYNAKDDGALKKLTSHTVSGYFHGVTAAVPRVTTSVDDRDREKGQCVRKYNEHEVSQKAGYRTHRQNKRERKSAKVYQSIAAAAVAAVL